MNLYSQCPKRFKYARIDKIPSEGTDRTALIKGGAVHDMLEKFPEASTFAAAPKYQPIVDNFIKSDLGKKYFSRSSTREHKFALNNKLEECSYYDKENILVRGSIDYMCLIDGVLNLIDWKTGKYRDEKYQDYDQLILYSIFIFLKYPHINKIIISYVYVEHDLENRVELVRENLNNYVQELISKIKTIENDYEFKKNPTHLCNWCDYQLHCSKDV